VHTDLPVLHEVDVVAILVLEAGDGGPILDAHKEVQRDLRCQGVADGADRSAMYAAQEGARFDAGATPGKGEGNRATTPVLASVPVMARASRRSGSPICRMLG
jgi:hypothetical protein